jgi:hypothetical protein
MTIHDEIGKLRILRDIGCALVQFTTALAQGRFEFRGSEWVYYPANFVVFRVQWKRNQDIVLTLRGSPHEFEAFKELPLRPGRATYSRCTVTNPGHLRATACYIARAHELWQRGRSRRVKRPVTTEV